MSVVHVIDQADAASLQGFDAIIDVRSPGEFAGDHVPGAENLPVLSDAERAEVGTIYVQSSRFEARRIGAAHVARNIAAHLGGALAGRGHDFHPLVYCWRGGQRSNAMASVLAQVGWRTGLLEGGYRTYRRGVQQRLYEAEPAFRLVLLDGHTGSAKTEMLGRLEALGLQVLDLEALAGHRGSLFGALAGQAQPSQKLFETRLLSALDRLDLARPILAEAESNKIGERFIPPMLWQAMEAAQRIEIRAPRAERARYLVSAYEDITRDRAGLEAALTRLPVHPGRKRLEDWCGLADTGAFEALAEALIELHYDPAYDRSSRRDARPQLGVVEVERLDPDGQDEAVRSIADLIA